MDSRPVFSSRSDGPNASGRFSSSCQPVCESSGIRTCRRNSSCLSHLGDQDIQRTDSVWKPQSIQPLGDRALLLLVRSKEPYIRLHERDPRIKADSETIRKSLEGNWRPEHLFTLAQSRDLCRVYQQQIVNCDLEIEKMLPEFEPRVDPAERPLPADRERRRARRMQKWPSRPEFDLRRNRTLRSGCDANSRPAEKRVVTAS